MLVFLVGILTYVATELSRVLCLQAGQGANGVADEEHDHDEHSEEVREVGVMMLNYYI
jgi:hypothetical protein